jgi:hypothetical protein
MAATKAKSTIPASNHPFMTWTGNYQTKINGFIAGPNAPDGEPYFYPRAIKRWNSIVLPAIAALQAEWVPVSTKGTHNSGQTAQFTTDRKKFEKTILRPWNKEFVLYNSAFTVGNRSDIGVLPMVSTQRTSAAQTTEQLFASWKYLGGCVLEFHCSVLQDASKASVPEGKIVQFGYVLVDKAVTGTVQPAPPQSILDCPLQNTSTHALFNFGFGAQNSGKILYMFFRWFDIHNNERSGPWSALYTIQLV